MKILITGLLAMAAVAVGQIATVSEPALEQIHAAAATTKPELTTSSVKGLVYDRFYQVWLENIVRYEILSFMIYGYLIYE